MVKSCEKSCQIHSDFPFKIGPYFIPSHCHRISYIGSISRRGRSHLQGSQLFGLHRGRRGAQAVPSIRRSREVNTGCGWPGAGEIKPAKDFHDEMPWNPMKSPWNPMKRPLEIPWKRPSSFYVYKKRTGNSPWCSWVNPLYRFESYSDKTRRKDAGIWIKNAEICWMIVGKSQQDYSTIIPE